MAADFLHKGADAAVFRTKVVPPFGDTVGLVHRIKGYGNFTQQGYVFLFCEGFGCDVEDFRAACQEVVAHLVHLGLVKAGIEEVRDAPAAGHESTEHVYLILHQGDERRNHYGRAVHDEGGQLIAERFAAAGRHEHEGVATVQQVIYYLLLITLEVVVSEEFL